MSEYTPELVEMAAKEMHEQWKQIIAYEDLKEETKELNRNTVRAVLDALDALDIHFS